MNFKYSLQQIWLTLILVGVLVPIIVLVTWFSIEIYESRLTYALDIQKKQNESVRDHISAEVNRLETLLKNKSDALSLFVKNKNKTKELNHFMQLVIQREQTIHEVILVSENSDVITAVNRNYFSGKITRSKSEIIKEAKHWGISDSNLSPEVVIPFRNKTYIGTPKSYDGHLVFSLAIPIGSPVKAVLIAFIDVDKLWSGFTGNTNSLNLEDSYGYLLDQHGLLLTPIDSSNLKPGKLMTYLPIVRAALARGDWALNKPYTGAANEIVFGSVMTIHKLDWSLVSEVVSSRITQPIINSIVKIILVVLCAVVIFIYFILFLVKKTLLPFDRLCIAIEYLSRGDYSFKLKSSGIREFDSIGMGFNMMVLARKKAEQDLTFAKQEAIRASEAKTVFLSSMSHELRTPLNAILGFGQLLQRGIKDDLYKSNADEIVNAGEHLLSLINEILDLSRIEAGKLVIVNQESDLNIIVNESITLVETLANERGICIENLITSTTDYKVYVDAIRLKQVMINLLSNAIKFNKDDGSITISCDVESDNYLRVDIADTGSGIGKEYIKHLFTPFERVEDKYHVEGAGIGLAITKGLIEAMGGTIGVESELGRGSTFWFKIKLA